MKKILTLFVALLFFFSMQIQTTASEDRLEIPYFGVGAIVQSLGDGSFLVKTEGVKAEEGFVYTYPGPFTSKNIIAQITLKGKGTVIFRISETNPRGQFIKQQTMMIELTEEWATYELPFILNSTSSQIDVAIYSEAKEPTEFYFKDLKINEQ